MPLLEKSVELQVVQWAIRNKFLAPKVKFVEAGWPDRLFLGYGASIFIEFKRPGEFPDALQQYRLAQLAGSGIPAYWVDNAIEGINILKAAMESARVPETSDKAPVVPIGGGTVPGPRTGENLDLFGSPKDSTLKGLGLKDSYHSPASPDVQRLAGGNTEVGGVPGNEVRHPPRDPEGDGPDYGLTDSYN